MTSRKAPDFALEESEDGSHLLYEFTHHVPVKHERVVVACQVSEAKKRSELLTKVVADDSRSHLGRGGHLTQQLPVPVCGRRHVLVDPLSNHLENPLDPLVEGLNHGTEGRTLKELRSII